MDTSKSWRKERKSHRKEETYSKERGQKGSEKRGKDKRERREQERVLVYDVKREKESRG